MTPKRIGKGMWAIAWVLLLAMLYQFFDGQVEERYSPNQKLSDVPASTVVLKRNHSGHYVAPGKINGTEVIFLLDTGATTVSIPSKVADEIGLQYGHKQQVGTANGVIDVYSTKLSSVQLGGITLNNVRGHINPYMDNSTVLLGMSFMRDLEIIQKGDFLTIKL